MADCTCCLWSKNSKSITHPLVLRDKRHLTLYKRMFFIKNTLIAGIVPNPSYLISLISLSLVIYALFLQLTQNSIRQNDFYCPHSFLADSVINPAGAPTLTFYCMSWIRDIADLTKTFHHHTNRLGVILVIGLFLQFHFHPRFQEIMGLSVIRSCNCEIYLLHDFSLLKTLSAAISSVSAVLDVITLTGKQNISAIYISHIIRISS